MTIRLDKDAGYHYVGRCIVNEYASDMNIHQITVGGVIEPYKLKDSVTEVSQDGSGEVTLTNSGRRTAIPQITVTAETQLTFDDHEVQLSIGAHKILDLTVPMGGRAVTVDTTGEVTFTYQEGDL